MRLMKCSELNSYERFVLRDWEWGSGHDLVKEKVKIREAKTTKNCNLQTKSQRTNSRKCIHRTDKYKMRRKQDL